MSQIIVDVKTTTENPAGIFFLTEAWTFSTPTLRRAPSNHVSHQWSRPKNGFRSRLFYFVLFDFHSELSKPGL